MTKRFFLACAIGLALGLVGPAATASMDGGAPPPQVAQACIQHVTHIAQHRVQRTMVAANHCVNRIEMLLAAGHPQAAHQTAQQCVVRITQGSSLASAHIQAICAQCTFFLVSHGAPGLAQMVQNVCANRIEAVQISRMVAINAIQNALPDPP